MRIPSKREYEIYLYERLPQLENIREYTQIRQCSHMSIFYGHFYSHMDDIRNLRIFCCILFLGKCLI